MHELVADPKLIAACGLYCGACKKYLAGSCPGCAGNDKATWCNVRTCTREHGWASCAECTEHADPATCKTHDNVIARLFGLVFDSNRRACVLELRARGPEGFARFMTERKRQSLPRKWKVGAGD
jgi:hypothetical protein